MLCILRCVAMLLCPVLAMAAEGAAPAPWAVAPFAILLLCVAILPLVAAHWWHRWYPAVAIGLGLVVAGYYLGVLGKPASLVHVGFEYLGFITLIGCLYLCSGGVVVGLGMRGTPGTNTGLLLFGAGIANIIGTTGASMLLIRPFLRLNRGRLRPYHVVFFIFLVSNVGGALTPIGDPPLLLGFLRGIPFFRFAELNFGPWLVTVAALAALFYGVDARNPHAPELEHGHGGTISLRGGRNLLMLIIALGCIFIDPNRVAWVPGLGHDAAGWRLTVGPLPGGEVFSFVREALLAGIGWYAWRTSPAENLEANGFTFAPLKEVALLFIGIFLTMVPALELIRADAADGTLLGIPLTPMAFYLGTGLCSAILDNAPTFIAFLAGIEGATGLSVPEIGTTADAKIALDLAACACASVFFGAMTYIGNGPNFMVKAICEDTRDAQGQPVVAVPGFFGYIGRYALPILLPVLLVTGWIFFR